MNFLRILKKKFMVTFEMNFKPFNKPTTEGRQMSALITITEEQKNLDFEELKNLGSWDNAKRWFPIDQIEDYFGSIRYPSRTWNNSYFNAAKTQKFLKWLKSNHSDLIKIAQ